MSDAGSKHPEQRSVGSGWFGVSGAVLVGTIAAIGFLDRGGAPAVALIGVPISFLAGAGWVLLGGRLRTWLVASSGWNRHLQGLVFVTIFWGLPLALGIGLARILG